MAKLVSVFISAAHRRLIRCIVFALAFAVALTAFAGYALYRTAEAMRFEARTAVDHFTRLRVNLDSTFAVMHADLTAEPCTPAFNEQLRRVAYLPDGLNEFLYAPGGQAQCSVSTHSFERAVDLGSPDFTDPQNDIRLWFERDLGFLGLEGMRGSIALNEPFAAIVPPQEVAIATPEWMSAQVVVVGSDGRWRHRGGEESVYQRQLDFAEKARAPLFSGVLHGRKCGPPGPHCVALEADLTALLAAEKPALAATLAMASLLAALATWLTDRLLARYWSFEARFRRHLDAGSIICAYQPVMELRSGRIIGCEVLARWRDIDDSVVYPDRFINLLDRHDMTLRFTELVAQRACTELCAQLPEDLRVQVNFNIFPRDLDSAGLAGMFSGFTRRPDRFEVVLEIIESDEIPADAQDHIEALRRIGIKTYIDDFGTGYSNMQNLAALSVDGVKLDRAFAMAPDDSMMAQMLQHAVEMIRATGRVMVVEGVETAERLRLLREMGAHIDFVQGYHISHPLDAAGFAAFVARAAAHAKRPGVAETAAA